MSLAADQNNTFSFDLVAPERVLASQDATMVTIPGDLGDFGVLVGHAPLVSGLRAGVVRVFVEPDRKVVAERFFVSGGVAEVNEDHCIVLAEKAVPVSEIDESVVLAEVSALHGRLGDAQSPEEMAYIQSELQVFEAMLLAVKHPVL